MKNFEQFYEDVKTNPELQQKLSTAQAKIKSNDPKAAFEQILPVIREAGYDFSLEELEAYAKEHQPNADGEMSLDELDAVAGGGGCFLVGFDVGTFCIAIGADNVGFGCFLVGR